MAENERKPYFDNRDLSCLKFNQRVLEEAEDEKVPLFERLRFVQIFCSNLDEFFMVRVGSLHDQTLLIKEKIDNKTNLTPREQLSLIAEQVSRLIPVKDKTYIKYRKIPKTRIVERRSDLAALNGIDQYYIENYFTREIFPLLSPSIIDKKHPVPFIKNKEIYFGAVLKKRNSEKHSTIIGILPATSEGVFPRVVYLPCDSGVRFIRIENLILYYADRIFPNYEVTQKNIFRITRNADLEAEEALIDHEVDFRDVMEELIKKRKKLAPVRVEFFEKYGAAELEIVTDKLELDIGERFIFTQSAPLDMNFVDELEDRVKAMENSSDMFYEPLSPQFPSCVNKSEPMMKQIKEHDILVTYPYESFKPFVNLLEQAASDPAVVSIKITLYRVARGSQIVNALISAAENGKDVLALVELRARFDEENNIGWSKRLEEAGVKIIYGLDGMKVHSKLLLITRRTGISIQYFTQIGTGNYNERTSKLYTDLTLMTADQEIGTDASMVFNALSLGATVESSTALWVAPNCLKSRVVAMIDNEISYGSDGYIGLKLNSLTDKDIIEKLVQASQNGVKVQLLVRGICAVAE